MRICWQGGAENQFVHFAQKNDPPTIFFVQDAQAEFLAEKISGLENPLTLSMLF